MEKIRVKTVVEIPDELQSLIEIQELIRDYNAMGNTIRGKYSKHLRKFNMFEPDNGYSMGQTIEHAWKDLDMAKIKFIDDKLIEQGENDEQR